jgi:hypothetical protein
VNYTATLYGSITHTTARGEIVADEGIDPIQLCHSCTTEVTAALGLKIRTSHYGSEDSSQPVAGNVEMRAHP